MFSLDTGVRAPSVSRGSVETSVAFVLHQVREGHSQQTVITRHSVEDNQLQMGQLINAAELKQLVNTEVNSTSQKKDLSELMMPRNIILETASLLVWEKPSFVGHMWFRLNAKKPFALRVRWPRLLFVAQRDELTQRRKSVRMFALGLNHQVKPNTWLYRVPLMNVSDDGLLCTGSAPMPKEVTYQTMTGIEDTLIKPNFTHLSCRTDKLPHYKTDEAHVTFWRKKAKGLQRVKAADMLRYSRLEAVLEKYL